MAVILKTQSVTKKFGGFTAVEKVSLSFVVSVLSVSAFVVESLIPVTVMSAGTLSKSSL